MKHFYSILLTFAVVCVVFCTGCKSSSTQKETNVIHVDIKNASAYDMSDMLDTSFFRIVALEMTPECLVGGRIKDVFYRHSHIYVWEKQSKAIFMFDENGKYLNKIHSPGEGPEDYMEMSQVRMTDENIYVYDVPGRKVLCYDTDCNFQKVIYTSSVMEEIINPNFMWVVDDRMFFANLFLLEENSTTKKFGTPAYKVASMDMNKKNVKYHLPYDIKSPTEPTTYFYLNNQSYEEVDGQVRFMTSRTDTIWKATRDDVVAEYVLDFGEQHLPSSMIKGEFNNIYENDAYNKYALVQKMHDTHRYIILRVIYENGKSSSVPKEIAQDPMKQREWLKKNRRTNISHVIIDKKTGESQAVSNLSMSAFDRYNTIIENTDGSYIISYEYPLSPFFDEDGKRKHVSTPSNPHYERVLNEVYETFTLNSNPIITILKFKE